MPSTYKARESIDDITHHMTCNVSVQYTYRSELVAAAAVAAVCDAFTLGE